jgi:hypothetical protein
LNKDKKKAAKPAKTEPKGELYEEGAIWFAFNNNIQHSQHINLDYDNRPIEKEEWIALVHLQI